MNLKFILVVAALVIRAASTYVVSGLHECFDTHDAVTTLLHINMDGNDISHHGVHHLSILLKIGCIQYLDLNGNNLMSQQKFSTFAEQLKYNATLKVL